MAYLVLQLASVSLFLAFIQGQIPPTGTQYSCEEQAKDGRALPHESRCDLYYVCMGMNKIVMMCGKGTLFNMENRVCDHESMAKCAAVQCNGANERYPAACCDQYIQCSGFSLKKENCPLGQTFDPNQRRCTSNGTCIDATEVCSRIRDKAPSHCNLDPSPDGDPCKFIQRGSEDQPDISKYCAAGTAFNATACECANIDQTCTGGTISPKCGALVRMDFNGANLSFVSDTMPPPLNKLATNVSDVSMLNNAARFSGQGSEIKCYFFRDNDYSFVSNIKVILKANSNAQAQSFVLFSNGCDDKRPPTLEAKIDYNYNLNLHLHSYTLTLSATVESPQSGQTTGTVTINENNYLEVVVSFDNGLSAKLTGTSPSGTPVSEPVTIAKIASHKAKIAAPRCDLLIGRGFTGEIKQFQVNSIC